MTQQGDPESPALISDSIRGLIDSLESKRNLWYLDDGNLSDYYRTNFKDLKKMKLKRRWDSKLTHEMRIVFLGDLTEKRRSTI